MLKSDPRAKQGLTDLEELEDRIEKLRQNFESFFAGIDNIDPSEKKVPIRRLITKLNEMHLLNPRARFRFQTIVGRFVTLEQHWTRTLHMIEEGRLKRGFFRIPVVGAQGPKAFFSKDGVDMSHLESVKEQAAEAAEAEAQAAAGYRPNSDSIEQIRAKRLAKLRGKRFGETDAETDEAQDEQETQASSGNAPAAIPKPAVQQTPQPPVQPKAAHVPPLSKERVDAVYQEFVAARKQAGQNAEGINPETLKAQVLRQAQLLKEKYVDKEIDFKVVNKDGKIVVQPVVRSRSQ